MHYLGHGGCGVVSDLCLGIFTLLYFCFSPSPISGFSVHHLTDGMETCCSSHLMYERTDLIFKQNFSFHTHATALYIHVCMHTHSYTRLLLESIFVIINIIDFLANIFLEYVIKMRIIFCECERDES